MSTSRATTPLPITERRAATDRRRDRRRAFLHSLFRGQRRTLRRTGDAGDGHYIDVLHPCITVFAVVIMLLSCADCLFTLLLLQIGAAEINPLMQSLIAVDSRLFVAVKLAVTASCVLFIVSHRHFRFFQLRGCHVLYAVLTMYLGLFSYQVSMLTV